MRLFAIGLRAMFGRVCRQVKTRKVLVLLVLALRVCYCCLVQVPTRLANLFFFGRDMVVRGLVQREGVVCRQESTRWSRREGRRIVNNRLWMRGEGGVEECAEG
ncbi:hypothetical protein EDD21DRAFT_392491 [Dissophora ornata]|nr:hypothetical protein EDD21DRAFT_392491 [Dissophora ornata]